MSKLQFSVIPDAQICGSPLNTSPAKQRYSFAKNDRFPKIAAEQYKYIQYKRCPLSCYDVPTTTYHKRSTSFGYGTKLDFTKTTVNSPSPTNYPKGSEFDKLISTKNGKSFGTCRNQMAECGHITVGPLKNPGVGNYNINRDMGNIKYTVRQKTNDLYSPVFLSGKRTYLENPGPGAYQTTDAISKDGKQFYSKYSSSGSKTFNPPQSVRFLDPATFVPGPSHYPTYEKSGINGNAKYVLSNHRSTGTRAFSHDLRIIQSEDIAKYKHNIPGPGSYRLPSVFGIYDHLDQYKQITNKQ